LKSKDQEQFVAANETLANLFVSPDTNIIDKAICEGYLPAVLGVACSSQTKVLIKALFSLSNLTGSSDSNHANIFLEEGPLVDRIFVLC
jgi:hypothetical protein